MRYAVSLPLVPIRPIILSSDGEQLLVSIGGTLIVLLIVSCLGVIFLPRLVANQRIKDLKDDLDLVRKAKQDYVDAVSAITTAKNELERKYQEQLVVHQANLEVQATILRENFDLKQDVQWLKDKFKEATGQQPPPRLRMVNP